MTYASAVYALVLVGLLTVAVCAMALLARRNIARVRRVKSIAFARARRAESLAPTPTEQTRSRVELSDDEIAEFLQAIRDGTITVVPEGTPQEVWWGVAVYTASNGWTVLLQVKGNAFAYIDNIESSDRRSCWYPGIEGSPLRLQRLQPTDEEAWRIWRLPGWQMNRCERCDAPIVSAKNGRDASAYVCVPCGGPAPRDEWIGPPCRCGAVQHMPREGCWVDLTTEHTAEHCGPRQFQGPLVASRPSSPKNAE
jgi:hypothetical protein